MMSKKMTHSAYYIREDIQHPSLKNIYGCKILFCAYYKHFQNAMIPFSLSIFNGHRVQKQEEAKELSLYYNWNYYWLQ